MVGGAGTGGVSRGMDETARNRNHKHTKKKLGTT